MRTALAALCLTVLAAGCVDNRPRGDAGIGPAPDAGPPVSDAGPDLTDGGAPPVDAGPTFPPGTTCTPGYACPEGSTFQFLAGLGRCVWEVDLPDTADVDAYCLYFSDGYLGFYWPLPSSDPDYACPPTFRYAPNAEAAYCLVEDFPVPAGATADCDGLLSTGLLGFRWTCPR